MYYLMLKQKLKDFLTEEDGIGTVEMILILVVLIGIVLIFKEQLNSLVESIFKTINEQAKKV
ncbi:Putative Flagellin, Flp1-like, domain [Pseudobutyrivibrio sp. C4]|uniref:Flp1 family type IVb pilin n=1 Tax=unclassified Pseudobutyrivibrio TaxID=2638619 RepID=UPI0008C744BA|nr:MULTISPECIES: Flp1 family type IVb pilin [unclassified Pseudobutyrivibrio]SET14227.1 Putative Flagellin, Flp1-like, domain [Pseudobutyrivibrio sp. C4]SFO39641.1 Putative Flagellin, Flp1-like, domain [Pseudobutyrivibrio sp. JW11]